MRISVVLFACIALAAALPAAEASASPSRGVSSDVVTQSALANTDYITRKITIAPGGSTGWHWHDGELVGVVEQGTLTHNGANCSVDGVYDVNDPVIEPVGADHVHIGRNLGAVPVILLVTYVDPVGKPLFEDAPNPGCDFD